MLEGIEKLIKSCNSAVVEAVKAQRAANHQANEVDRCAWNLAGCLTLAESRTLHAFNESLATPALLAVRKLLRDYLDAVKALKAISGVAGTIQLAATAAAIAAVAGSQPNRNVKGQAFAGPNSVTQGGC